jgi:hypothetical protein
MCARCCSGPGCLPAHRFGCGGKRDSVPVEYLSRHSLVRRRMHWGSALPLLHSDEAYNTPAGVATPIPIIPSSSCPDVDLSSCEAVRSKCWLGTYLPFRLCELPAGLLPHAASDLDSLSNPTVAWRRPCGQFPLPPTQSEFHSYLPFPTF